VAGPVLPDITIYQEIDATVEAAPEAERRIGKDHTGFPEFQSQRCALTCVDSPQSVTDDVKDCWRMSAWVDSVEKVFSALSWLRAGPLTGPFDEPHW
jgi:hypothetical protein